MEKREAEEHSCSRLVSWAVSFSSINGDNNSHRVVVRIKGDKIKHGKSLEECPSHSKSSVSISCHYHILLITLKINTVIDFSTNIS